MVMWSQESQIPRQTAEKPSANRLAKPKMNTIVLDRDAPVIPAATPSVVTEL